ncbi:target of Nesh-SH3 isoform X2 [Syngnathus acus]|uniref:target of Nesh-SH3 isoform X2 n=1 Tax=Syngnathus acus TaxID=161584 RepID=UPI0018861317|nr:target of Nesh-SH3 isoform X2 [Syngnathus acus]
MTRVQQRSPGFLVLFLVVLIAGIVLSGPSTPRRSRVRRQNMKVRINATGDTIVMKFVRPNTDTKLEGYILGYGSSMFSKQFIQLPENGKPYETEFDAEPKYLIAVQPIPTNDVKKHCTGKVEMDKPLHLVIGSVTPTSVLLSWGTLLKTPYEGNIMNDCLEDGHYTVRYRERNRKWNYQTCPTSDTVIDKLKPNAVYEFGVQPSSKDKIGSWSKPVIHNISSGVIQEKVIRKIFKRPISPVKPLAQRPHFPFTPRHVLHNRTQGRLPLSRHITPKTTLAPTTTTRQEPLSTTGSPAPVTTKQQIGGGLPQSVIPLFHEVPSVPNFPLPLQISPPAVSAPVPKQNSGQSPNHAPHLLNLHQLPTQSKPRPQQPQTGSQPKPQSDQLRFKPVVQHEPYPDLELHATTHNPSPTHYQTSQPIPQVNPLSETRSIPKMQTKLKTQTDPQPLSQPQRHDQTSQPIPQAKPQSETRSIPKMQTKLKTQTDPQPLSEPQTHDQTSQPIPQAKPQSETRSTPKMKTKLKTQTDPQPRSQPQRHDQTSQPMPQAKPQSETRSTPKMKTKLKTQTDPQPLSQPQTHDQTSQPIPQAKPQSETRSTPKMKTKLKTQTDPQPLSQPQTHDQTSQPIPQAKPQSETRSTPKMKTKLKTLTDPQPRSQPQRHDQTSQPMPQAKPQSETRSTPKMKTKLKTQTDPQPLSQPQTHDQTSQPIPQAKPQSETRSTPKMQTKLKTQTDPQPRSQPQRHDQTSQPMPQVKPQSETRSTPKMQTKLKTQTDPQPRSQPQRHDQTSQPIPQAKPQSETRSTPKMQTKLKTQRDPQPLSQRQTTSQPKPPNHPITQLIQPTQLISRPGFEAHPKLPQPTKQHQPQRQQVQTIPYILPKQPAQSSTEPQIKTIKTQSESKIHFETTSQPLQKTPRAPWPSTKEQFKVPKQPAQSATEPQIKTIQTQSESVTTFQHFILHKTSREPWPSTKKQFTVQSTSKPRTSSSTSTTHPLPKRTSQPEAHSQTKTQPSQPAKSQKQPTKHSDQPQPLDRTQSQPQSPLWSDPLPQSKPASQVPPTTQNQPHYESQTKVNPAPESKAEAQPGIEIQPRVTSHSGPIEVPPLQAVPTAPSPPEKGKPLPIPPPAAEKSDSNNLGTINRRVEAPRSHTRSSAIPSGRNTTFSRVRVPPHFPRNGVRPLPTSSHSSRTSGVLRQTIPVNKRPNLVGMPNDHDKPMDLKQGDKESILKPFPLVTSKPKHERRQQITTTTPPLNSSRFDVNENSSIFRPLPASDVDIMGKKRYVAPHVVYKTDKKPDEPCSITSSLSYFPDEEDGSDQNVTAVPRIPPTNLTVVTVEGCPSFVILDWQKTDNETREYEVVSTAKGPNGEEVSILTTTNQTHTAVENLKPESSYEFKVTPKNELGTGPSSEPVSFNTESADPRVSENVSGKDAIWTQFPFKTDGYSECNGKQYIKRTWYRKFVGIQLCNSLRYKIYLSDSLNGKFYNIGDQSGYGEDHCQFVDSFLDGRTGTQLFAHQLPPRLGYFRALRQEPVGFGEIGGKSHVTYVGWYECGTPIPGKW